MEGCTSVAEESAWLPVIAGGGVGGTSVTFFPADTGGGDDEGKEGAGAETELPPGEDTAGEDGEGAEKEEAGTRVASLCLSCLTASPPQNQHSDDPGAHPIQPAISPPIV